MKKLARYLVGIRAVVFRFEWQDKRTYTDSDWAGYRKTRKSTSGGTIMIGSHCNMSWSSTQGHLEQRRS